MSVFEVSTKTISKPVDISMSNFKPRGEKIVLKTFIGNHVAHYCITTEPSIEVSCGKLLYKNLNFKTTKVFTDTNNKWKILKSRNRKRFLKQ